MGPVQLTPRGAGTPGGLRQPPPISRTADRAVTAGGVGIAALYLAAAVAALALPEPVRHGLWLPLHLVLAGAAATVIAAVLPFFATSLLVAAPAPAAARVLAVGLVAAGAAGVATGVAAGASGTGSSLAAAGGTCFVAGIVATAWTTFRPLRGALGPRHALVMAAYAAALGDVAVGATLATLYVGGYEPVLLAWASLKPVHAWLNLLGFVSLLICGTLIHLYPTVLGTRIPAKRTAAAVAAQALVALLIAGPPLVAAGYWLGLDLLVRAGAVSEAAGAVALLVYAVQTIRTRGRWTTDIGWHRSTIWHLTAAMAWFAVAVAIASGRALAFGADPSGWSGADVAVPLAVGFVGQAIAGAWTHLVPSIGPGDQPVHARQRGRLGRIARTRVLVLEAGTAALALGVATASELLTVAGAAATAAVALVELSLLLQAAQEGRLSLVAALHDAVERR